MPSIDLNLNSLSIDKSGRATFSGLGSGIDFRAAVDAIVAAKKIPVDRLERRISANEAKVAAFQGLRSLLLGLRGAADRLRGAISLDGAGDVFKAKQAFASTRRADSTAPSAPTDLIGLTVTNAAQATSHGVEIVQVAAAHKVASATVDGARGDALGHAGTIEINGRAITIAATDSLLDVRDRINGANTGTDATGVGASVVSISATEHVLVLTAAKTGADNAIAVADAAGTVLQDLGVTDGGGAFQNELQAAQNAKLKVDGLAATIERPSNTIDDLFQGVTLSLFKAEPGTTIEVSVERNLSEVKGAVVGLVDAYNAVRTFINEQVQSKGATQEDDATYGALYGASALSDVRGRLSAVLGAGVEGLAEGFSVLAQIGITVRTGGEVSDPTLANTLKVDEVKLDEALLNRPDEVRRLFAFEASSSSPDVVVLGYGNATRHGAAGYALNVAVSGGVITSANVGGAADGSDDGSVRVDGRVLTVLTGGAEGLKLLYAGAGDASGVRLDVTVGFGAQLHRAVDALVDAGTGLIANEVSSLEGQNGLAEQRVERLSERIERERDRLLARFVAMETALTTMNRLLESLEQQIDAAFGKNRS
ncbi:MAG TPA: flagellar filament capping protein FliD [Geminicoccaceae bacterium]|nr:flagellar filament capping protein FliD [Geminicoccaceae bacterium]